MIRSRRIQSFAALAAMLLIAQLGALLHGYSHLRSKPDLTGVGTTASQVCAECLSCTPLLAAAAGPDPLVIFHPACANERPHAGGIPLIERSAHYAFRSRAPPVPV